jgi:hypothetical protein
MNTNEYGMIYPPPRRKRRVLKVLSLVAGGVAVAVVIIALAGCSGSSSGITGQAGAAAVAKSLGCTAIEPMNPPTYFAHSEVDATCQGHHADIATFTTDQARDEWAGVVRAQGATVQTGHLYAVGTGY